MGGRVEMKSALGEGTTMTVIIPVDVVCWDEPKQG